MDLSSSRKHSWVTPTPISPHPQTLDPQWGPRACCPLKNPPHPGCLGTLQGTQEVKLRGEWRGSGRSSRSDRTARIRGPPAAEVNGKGASHQGGLLLPGSGLLRAPTHTDKRAHTRPARQGFPTVLQCRLLAGTQRPGPTQNMWSPQSRAGLVGSSAGLRALCACLFLPALCRGRVTTVPPPHNPPSPGWDLLKISPAQGQAWVARRPCMPPTHPRAEELAPGVDPFS